DAVAGELEAEELGCAQLEVSNWTPERVEPGAELRRHLGIDVPRLGPEAPAATGRQLARRDLADEVLGREAEPHEEVGRVLVCKVDPLVVEVGADAMPIEKVTLIRLAPCAPSWAIARVEIPSARVEGPGQRGAKRPPRAPAISGYASAPSCSGSLAPSFRRSRTWMVVPARSVGR